MRHKHKGQTNMLTLECLFVCLLRWNANWVWGTGIVYIMIM